jgi:hypothetical protein
MTGQFNATGSNVSALHSCRARPCLVSRFDGGPVAGAEDLDYRSAQCAETLATGVVAPHRVEYDPSPDLGCNRQQDGHGGASDGASNIGDLLVKRSANNPPNAASRPTSSVAASG